MKKFSVNRSLCGEIEKLGARDVETCMQCGNCASACPLSDGENTFPRKIYRYLQLGLHDKVLESPEPWLCYYCGDCNTDCPRGAEPAETMMATRRWLTTQYDWTGLAKRFYESPRWEVGAFMGIALFVISLFVIFHGPVITDRVELNTFAPVHWVHIGDEIMILIVMGLLFSNAINMYRKIMQGTRIPFTLYLTQAPVFIINYFTQKRWKKCGTGPASAWWRHLFLFSGWVAMEVLVMIFLTSFQTDIVHPFWHPTRIVGYYATVALLLASGSMLYSRWFKKEENLHRYSDFTDMFFLVLIFVIALSGILVHFARLMGLPLTTYTIYVVHVGICVGMLMIMLPFGKLSHLMYRPLAIFLTTLKQKVLKDSQVELMRLEKDIGETFKSCMQCGTCTGVCPVIQVSDYSPRLVLRNISLNRMSDMNVDDAAWNCATCSSCVENCPRGIGIIDLVKSVRRQNVKGGMLPATYKPAVASLEKNGNPWQGERKKRADWVGSATIPLFVEDMDYYLFTCCTTAYDTSPGGDSIRAGRALLELLEHANVSYGTLGTSENCCGDQASHMGAAQVSGDLVAKNTEMFMEAGVKKILTTSPHCLNSFKKHYTRLPEDVSCEHYTELLEKKIEQGDLLPLGVMDMKVTYHDPCYLGRHNKIYEPPRRVLQSIPGLELTEMQNNRERSVCCGGGGGGAWNDAAPQERLGVIRVKEAIATGAEVIATACPYCTRMLNEAVEELGVQKTIKVRDISELLLQSISLSATTDENINTSKSLNQEECHV